jgi:hypothetical protein
MKVLKHSLILLGILFFFNSCNSEPGFTKKNKIDDKSVTLLIDGHEIKWEQYLFHLKKNIAFTYNHFYLNFGLENSNKFWETTIDGITPLDYIKTKTENQLMETRAILKLAKENNIINHFNFENFKILWHDYNKSRTQKNSNGQIIYGAITIDMFSYHNYLISNIKLRLKEKLAKTQFKIEGKLLKEYYEIIKSKQFSYNEKIEGVVFGFNHSKLPNNLAVKRIQEVKNYLKKGFSLNNSLEKKYPLGEYKKIVFHDSIPIFGEDNPDKIIRESLLKLNIGEFKVLKAQEGTFIIRLDYLSNKKYYPYEKVKKQVLNYYQNSEFDMLIEHIIKNTRLVINKEIYNSISKDNFL